uniref:Uncharacterized protein n=1 Tax=Avena sativa TaxID=4498 RepID=A0ACD5WRX8_AVESA
MFITNAHQYGPFGGRDGAPFHSPLIGSNSSIVGFFGRSGEVVDAIGLYVNIEREPMQKQGSITKFGLWGGDSGMHYDVEVLPRRMISVVVCSGKIMLGRSEIVKEVSGTVGLDNVNQERLTSLFFVTNIATYGPFGDGVGMPFRSPLQENDSIVGFFAKVGKNINAIGFYLASIEKKDNDGAACTDRRIENDTTKLDKAFITKIGPWGGSNGNHKDIEVPPLCLNSITIRSGEVIFSIAYSYKDSDRKQQHAGPWGASEGFSYGTFDTIQLEPLECLTEVSGTVDYSSKYSSDVITSVMFITNAHRYGPYGGGGGIPFRSPVLSSGNIVGFFAHAERVVDAIGLYVNIERQPTKEQGCTQDSVMRIGPWGSDSGRPNYVDVLPRRLIRVVVHSGKIINSLTFTYSDCNGQEHTAGPWGRTGEPLDGTSHTILFGQSDFLMEVSGTICRSSSHTDVVTSLLFVTNTGSYGPHGEGGGSRFSSPLQTNGSIVGFFANAEDVIHAIGVYISPQRDASTDR